mgnify:CR=1 FL=1
MYHPVKVEQLSKQQVSRLLNGHSVRIKHHPSGKHTIHMSKEQVKKVARAHAKGGAINLMLEEGLKDPDNSHFILLTGSCIPVKSFDYIYNYLNINNSYFNICPQEQCFPRTNTALKFIDKKFIQKTVTWSILNRKHCDLIIKDKSYLQWFDDCYAPTEHTYITLLYYYNLEIIFV